MVFRLCGCLDARTPGIQRWDTILVRSDGRAHTRGIGVNTDGAFAEYVLTDAARLWVEAPLDQKQRLQQVIFPRGVTYSPKRGFGTAETSVIFRLLQVVGGGKAEEVSPTGFEPVLPT